MKEIKNEILNLIDEINEHNENYYNNDNPCISDFDYDILMNRLKELEKTYPKYKFKGSPTTKVGGVAKFSPVLHKYKMESLQDVFSKDELFEFFTKTNKTTNNNEYVLEYKIDGLSVSLEYENGKLIRSATRGDGVTGEDVTDNILQIDCIAKEINDKRNIILRGEVYMKNSVFSMINSKRLENNEKLLANPRNAAAGSLRQLDSNLVHERKLSFICFSFENALENGFTSHVDALKFVGDLGIPVSPTLDVYKDFDALNNAVLDLREQSKELDFSIDGAVIKIDNLSDRTEHGSTSKFPKWAAAFKYPAEIQETLLEDIVITIGRTGVLTPNAVLKPVFLAGTTVSRATLHNKDFIENLDVRIGDFVNVRKAGEIIPEVISVNLEKRTSNSKPFEMPTVCPSCGLSVFYDENDVALRCNNYSCPSQIEENIIHFASKNAMDIDGLGDMIVKNLLEGSLIKDVSDIYYLKLDDLLNIERFALKSATNLIENIEKSKSNQLERLIFGLGIRHVGQKVSKILAIKFLTLDNLMSSKFEDLVTIDEIGPRIAKSVVSYFKLDSSKILIEKLREKNVNFTQESKVISDKLSNLVFVVTGTLELYNRKEITELIENLGGKVSGSVSKKTSYLVAGSDAGSKLKKALELDITVLSEKEFSEFIK